NEIKTPISTAPVSKVDTTAMTGSDSSRIDSNIFFGSVDASRPAMKIATTASLKECRKANSAPTRIPGRSTGRVTQRKVRSGPAHPEEGAQRPAPRAEGGALKVESEAFERRGNDKKSNGYG